MLYVISYCERDRASCQRRTNERTRPDENRHQLSGGFNT